jgi:hypothetical protein
VDDRPTLVSRAFTIEADQRRPLARHSPNTRIIATAIYRARACESRMCGPLFDECD